ncbi:MAG: DNA-binding response regulator [Halochromatium sp.]|nr:DNA-binding response regulator [Halochromatium sp.]
MDDPVKTEDPASIIVVEDDKRMARALERNLSAAGYQVTLATSGREFRHAYRRSQADLILLDLNLGAEDGLDLARELGSSSAAAIIIVTGRNDLHDRIEGLDAGADDYIAKPFVIEELLARVRAVLRRRSLAAPTDGKVELGPYRLDTAALSLCREGSSPPCISLTETEARILAVLLHQHGRAVSRERLMARELNTAVDRSIDVHIGNIRRKLRNAQMLDLIIWPVRGFGYRLRLES